MNSILDLLQQNARYTTSELADHLNLSVEDVEREIAAMEENGTILGYHAVVDKEKAGDTAVSALIEIKLTPQGEGGFNLLAKRIAKFSQVTSCYLMSGGYDLAAIVQADTLQEVAKFVSEKLSTIDGVIATSTHFQLKAYKDSGFIAKDSAEGERPAVS